jgi:hypothetical protein
MHCCWSLVDFADTMDIARILLRIFLNFLQDLPRLPRDIKVRFRLRRRNAAWRVNEADRLDRLRNPARYRGL